MQFLLSNELKFSNGNSTVRDRLLLIEVEVVDVVLPVVQCNSRQLIRFEHHGLVFVELDHHCDVVVVTCSEEPLEFASSMVGKEQQNITRLGHLDELPLGKGILVFIEGFRYGLEQHLALKAVHFDDRM